MAGKKKKLDWDFFDIGPPFRGGPPTLDLLGRGCYNIK
jgi:hypothetical protein